MSSLIRSDSWTHRGISLLWDSNTLNSICEIDQIYSLREYFSFYFNGWPQELQSADGYAMIVAGLETVIDVMEPNLTVQWLEKVLYQSLLSFQSEFEGQCALIFWMPEGQARIIQNITDELFYWKLGASFQTEMIPLSHCLWNGAARDAKLIAKGPLVNDVSDKGCIGLFHPRIS